MTRSRFNYLFKNLWKNCKDFLLSMMKHQFSQFISAYRKSFSLGHVLSKFLEDWRNKLDNNDVVSAVLTDLPKTFDWIPHDSLVAKVNACSFNRDTVAYIYSYLKNKKQYFRINTILSYLRDIVSVVPQGPILGPILYITCFLVTSFISFY